MSLRFAESSGQYHAAVTFPAGIWGGGSTGNAITSTALPRNGNTWAYGPNLNANTPQLTGTGFNGMVAGYACFIPSNAVGTLIRFLDASNTEQCSLRMTGTGALTFNLGAGGAVLGGPSVNTLSAPSWHYFEFKASFSTTGTGTCEVRVDGIVWLTTSSITNATTTAKGFAAGYNSQNATNANTMDFYAADTDAGTVVNYLGDITVAEIYLNGAGVNAQWTVQQGSFTLTSVANASGGTTVYTGTITNGTSPTNAYQGFYFSITGFVTGANNGGPWLCTASTTTTITLQNPSGVTETHAGTCAFQNPLQLGIHGGINDGYATTLLGNRPPSGTGAGAVNQYIFDNTATHKTDYAHQALSLTGTIGGVVHITNALKDDAGTRQIQQICLSAGTEEDSATITLTSSYVYYTDVLENDPHTSAAWTLTNFNNATFGVKEIT